MAEGTTKREKTTTSTKTQVSTSKPKKTKKKSIPASEESQTEPISSETEMQVQKRDGRFQPVNINKIVQSVERGSAGLSGVVPLRVAAQTISGISDGTTTTELDELSIRTAAALITEEPNYSRLAARLLTSYIEKEVDLQNIHSFSQSIDMGHSIGLIADDTAKFVKKNSVKLNRAINNSRNELFSFFGLSVVHRKYLLRHSDTRKALETPQYFFLRVACGLTHDVYEAISFYKLISSLSYLPSSPTLFNSGTTHPQMSSCYLLDSPEDSLGSIYDKYKDVALLSKYAGGIGLSYSRIRSEDSLIKGTNGKSNGIVPWLKTLNSSVSAVNQGGRRKGAACVYLESWHADIESFLELRDNTGDEARRAHNLNLANWVSDLFMERVEEDSDWSLFDPKKVPELVDSYGDEFRELYVKAESEMLYEKQIPAQSLYRKMLRTLAQTGNGWMAFKDASNLKCNQTGTAEGDEDGKRRTVHLSNLCTEIIEVTDSEETAVCNLGSINVGSLVNDGSFDFDQLGKIVSTAVLFLDKVIDINFYPIPEAQVSNEKWRPIGLGLMGLQDVFFKLGVPFQSKNARELSQRISEEIYYWALSSSCDLAEKHGPHPAFNLTRAAQGKLQYHLWGVNESDLTDPGRWEELVERISTHGLRNSLTVAIAPTATIASIAGCYECIEPQLSNLFKRETLSGEYLQINEYLVKDLQKLGLWDESMISALKRAEGSVRDIENIPEELKQVYSTAWELPMRVLIDMAADRGPFIDQSQSLNLFMADPTIPKLSSMYLYAWKQGLKTTYYLRTRAATRINQATSHLTPSNSLTEEELACSLENPETCDVCN